MTAVVVTGLALATAATAAAAHVGVNSYSPKRGSTASHSLERVTAERAGATRSTARSTPWS